MMQKNIERLIYWKIKTAKTEQGFVTLEVIMALIVGLAFFAFSLQAFVFSIAMKVQAQEKQRANELIQEDVERISQLGSNPELAGDCNPLGGIYVGSYAEGLLAALTNAVPNETQALRKTIINKIKADGTNETGGNTLALERLPVSNAAGQSTNPHRTLKIGYKVWYWGKDRDNPGADVFLNRASTERTTTDNAIAETYVEIIPDVALSCP